MKNRPVFQPVAIFNCETNKQVSKPFRYRSKSINSELIKLQSEQGSIKFSIRVVKPPKQLNLPGISDYKKIRTSLGRTTQLIWQGRG